MPFPGTAWKSGSWDVDAWAADTWAGGVAQVETDAFSGTVTTRPRYEGVVSTPMRYSATVTSFPASGGDPMSSTNFAPRVGSTNLVELSELLDHIEGDSPTDATVTVTVLDPTGAVLSGANSLPMPYDATAQVYRGVLPSTLGFVVGSAYTRVVTVVGSTGDRAVFSKTGFAAAG